MGAGDMGITLVPGTVLGAFCVLHRLGKYSYRYEIGSIIISFYAGGNRLRADKVTQPGRDRV